MVSPRHLGRSDRHRRRDVCDSRRLRSRPRHPVSVCPQRTSARSDDALDRAVLGRQRDMAGARRRRIMGGIPGRLCRDHAGDVSAGDRDAAGAGVPRRGIRISYRLREQAAVEFCLHVRLIARGVLAGRDPGRTHSGHHGCERAICRRAFRLGDAVRHPVRSGAGLWLCTPRRDLADHEDRRRGRRSGAPSGQGAFAYCARLHGGGVSLHALRDRTHRQSLVLAAELLLSVAGAAGDRAGGVSAVALDRQGA